MSNSFSRYFVVVAVLLLMRGRSGAGENLLINGAFSDLVGTERPSGWMIPQSTLRTMGKDAEFVQFSVEQDEAKNRFMGISIRSNIKASVWLQQEIKGALGGAVYEMTLRVAGEAGVVDGVDGYTVAEIGVYFLGERGQWLGYSRVPPEELTFPFGWRKLSLRATAPEKAAVIGVRVGAMASKEMEIRFDDVCLVLVE